MRGSDLVWVGAAPGQRLHVAEDQVLAVLVDAELLQELQHDAEMSEHEAEADQAGPFERAARRRQHLGVGGRSGRTDALDPHLGELAVPSPLGLLVAEGRAGVVDADRQWPIAQVADVRAHHGCRQLRAGGRASDSSG